MNSAWKNLVAWFSSDQAAALGWSVVILIFGLLLARLSAALVGRMTRRISAQYRMVAQRVVRYTITLIALIAALRQAGFDLSVLVGAAGILTIALGFASQTSASNLISGLFLMGEKPFVVGDVIRVGTTTGEVISIDLLSVKLRTFDNLLVRLPNESLLKSELTNLTRFPLRRVDLKIGVAYKEDIGRVRSVLLRVAERNPLCLDEPAPIFIFEGFGASSLDIQFSVWAATPRYLELKTSIYEEIKRAFDEEGIEIPFPHVSVYA
ncbi:MAG: mechanosensitive ion channel family protein, partial [Nannocystaceae bacterium]